MQFTIFYWHQTETFCIQNMYFYCFFAWSFIIFAEVVEGTVNQKSDVGLSVIQIIKKYHFPLEVYSNIKTEDNYLLDVYRIPHGRTNTNGTRTPILLVHGLLGTSKNFIAMGPEKGLAFVLAEQGYDVWMGNCRGTMYSRKHTYLNPDKDSAYWTFSMHEIGVYDLPAMISLVLKVTKVKKIAYAGHSQGTTNFYIMASSKPEYNKKISIMASLAPIAYLENIFNPLYRFFSKFEPIFTILARVFQIHDFPPIWINNLLVLSNRVLCQKAGVLQEICACILYITGGYSPSHINKQALATLFSDGGGGSSVYQSLHYSQFINSGQFKPFNWERKINLQKYGSAQPQFYNISKITAPVGIFYAENDWLASPKDVQRLHAELPNPVFMHKVDSLEFNHYDFMYGIDANELVFKPLLSYLNLHVNK